MNLYHIEYRKWFDNEVESDKVRKYQILAETEQEALIKFGQTFPHGDFYDRIIKLISIKKVA